MEFFEIFIAGVFINNILLAQFLGNCPFLGTSKKMETAVGMAMAVIFVLVMAGMITWIVDTYLLKALDVEYLRTVSFILVIASLVQFVEMFLKKSIPGLYAGLGIFLPLITTNCAVMGAMPIIKYKQRILIFKRSCILVFICCGIWACSYSFCRCQGKNQPGQGTKTPAGYIHRPCNCGYNCVDIHVL